MVGQITFGNFSADSVEKNALPEGHRPFERAVSGITLGSRVRSDIRNTSKWNPDASCVKSFVDSFETPLPRHESDQRGTSYQIAVRFIREKQKSAHIENARLVTDQKAERFLDVSGGHRGPKSDVTIWNETGVTGGTMQTNPKVGDKAFNQGAQKLNADTKVINVFRKADS